MKENVELCVLLGYCGLHPQLMDKLQSMLGLSDIMVALSIVGTTEDDEQGNQEIIDSIVGRVVQIVENEKNRVGSQVVH